MMPPEIRTAVSTCSTEKVEEVEQEYTTLKPILEKLKKLPLEHKVLPLLPEYAGLSSEDELYMIGRIPEARRRQILLARDHPSCIGIQV